MSVGRRTKRLRMSVQHRKLRAGFSQVDGYDPQIHSKLPSFGTYPIDGTGTFVVRLRNVNKNHPDFSEAQRRARAQN